MTTSYGDRSSANACGAPASVVISAHFIYKISILFSLYRFISYALRKPVLGFACGVPTFVIYGKGAIYMQRLSDNLMVFLF